MGRPLKKPDPLPTIERLRQLVRFDARTGRLFWLHRDQETFSGNEKFRERTAMRWNRVFAGKEAGGDYHGYRRLMIDGVHHFAHRVIWKMETGEEPVEIDHINGDKGDNRLANLRSVVRPVNMKNKALYKSNSSGFPGVEFHARDRVWVAKIGVGGGQLHLGNFKTKDEAVAARIAAQVVLDFHPNHGREAK